jgi:amino acid transporter
MYNRLKNLLIGSPLPTYQLAEKRLNKIRALAAFSPDALSSIAYANQEIYLGLVIAGGVALNFSWPIGIAITLLLGIVAISYYQTIHGYPSGGGSYVVARENLGILPGLIAAAALIIDYILTAAVSLTAGVEALASAFPGLLSYRIIISLTLLLLITLANLRGLRETGTLLAIPVYLFLFSYMTMIIFGVYRLISGGPVSWVETAPPAIHPLTLLLVLRAFSTGTTALTGIEAISNGVPVFRPPEAKNAGRTLVVMAVLMAILFVGSIGLTQFLGVVAGAHETILSALARNLLGNSIGYYIIQLSTLLILAVAANTSFAGFPRLAAILATDGFLPRQFTGLGDRLVFSNGIIVLALTSGVLIILFEGRSHALIPLFAVGVFLAFTLSQIGMVIHWNRVRSSGWVYKSILNGVGAFATAVTAVVVGFSKFTQGAWITLLLIILLVYVFRSIKDHYKSMGKQLSLRGLPPSLRPTPAPRIVIPISGVHRGIIDAMDFSNAISKDVTAVYIELEPGSAERVQELWRRWFPDVPLVILQSPYRSIVGPLLDYLDETDSSHNDGQLATVVVPEFIPAKPWQGLLHNQTSRLLKNALLYRRRNLGYQRVIIDVPYHLKR